jgi:hypothetical protein
MSMELDCQIYVKVTREIVIRKFEETREKSVNTFAFSWNSNWQSPKYNISVSFQSQQSPITKLNSCKMAKRLKLFNKRII